MEIYNPNRDIFEVETLEGTDTDDKMSPMIGDTVQKHVSRLSDAERLVWESFYYAPSGAIFRFSPSSDPNSEDSIKNKKTLKNPDDDSSIKLLEEELQRLESKKDIYNKSQAIPWEEWVRHPQQGREVDIPTTPKDRAIYCGNSRQAFYDFFPEEHTDAKALNTLIYVTSITNDTDFLQKIVGNLDIKKNYSRKHIKSFIDNLENHYNEEEAIRKLLTNIDNDWSVEFMWHATKKLTQDSIFKLMCKKNAELEELKKKGQPTFNEVKAFGRELFELLNKKKAGQHDRIKHKYYWSLYNRLKRKYKPKVVVQNIDVNSSHVGTMSRVFNVSRIIAANLWHNRIYTSKSDFLYRSREYLGLEVSGHITSNIKNLIDKTASISERKKDITHMSYLGRQLFLKQQNGDTVLDWNDIWSHYKSMKAAALDNVNNNSEILPTA